MNFDQQVDKLWRRVDVATLARPTWRNSPSVTGFRSYGDGDAKLQIEGDRLLLVKRKNSKFVLTFGSLFLPLFAAIPWFIPDTQLWARLSFSIAGTVVGAATIAVIFFLMRYDEGLGDYLVIDRSARVLQIPRLNKEFPFAQAIGFQWIRGSDRYFRDNEVDLNLLASEEGQVVRFHLMGNPKRSTIKQVVAFSGLPLDEIHLGWRGDRTRDKNSPA